MSARDDTLELGVLGLGLLILFAPGPMKTLALFGLLGVG